MFETQHLDSFSGEEPSQQQQIGPQGHYSSLQMRALQLCAAGCALCSLRCLAVCCCSALAGGPLQGSLGHIALRWLALHQDYGLYARSGLHVECYAPAVELSCITVCLLCCGAVQLAWHPLLWALSWCTCSEL